MVIKIRKGEMIDDLIWFLMLFQIMIGNYLGIWRVMSIVVLTLVIVSCIKDLKYFTKKGLFIFTLFLCCTLIYPFYSYQKDGGDPYILANNIYYIITPFSLVLYTAKSCTMRPGYTRRKLEGNLTLLNLYAIINIFVIIFQAVYNSRIYANSVEYWDSISGLFGKYGQPNITLFISAVILFDFLNLKFKNNNTLRYSIKSKTIPAVLLISYMIFGALNDNKAFYLIFLLFAASLWFISKYEYAFKRNQLQRMLKLFVKIILIAVAGLVALAILINYTVVGDFYNTIMHEITMGWNKTNLVQGSNERIGIISYALANPEMRWDGYGLATTIWKKEYAFGFMHFGQSDVGVFVLLGGLIFMGLILLYLFFALKQMFKHTLVSIIGVIAMIVVGIYTQVFTTFTMMGCMILFLLVCWEAQLLQRDRQSLYNESHS